MAKASVCECGHKPKNSDCHEVVMNEGAAEYEYTVLHVICYACGAEWVE